MARQNTEPPFSNEQIPDLKSLPIARSLHDAADVGRGTIRIAETFTSRQGEGRLTGTQSVFIRTSGCNLRCWFCDTPYASWKPEGESMSVEALVDLVDRSGTGHVVLTGGEPLVPAAVEVLCDALQSAGHHLTIETAGTIDRAVRPDLLSLSPKLSSSTPDSLSHPRWSRLHEERRMPISTMKSLIARSAEIQVKFVASSPAEMAEIAETVERLGVSDDCVYVMPEGTTVQAMDAASVTLRPPVEAAGWQYCDRMQIRWYGNRRGT